MPEHAPQVRSRFPATPSARASDLPSDGPDAPDEAVRWLVAPFRDTGKELFFLDLTTVDVRELGLVAVRVWSPDTLSLCLPSAPPLAHPRFAAYGGGRHARPHPYP